MHIGDVFTLFFLQTRNKEWIFKLHILGMWKLFFGCINTLAFLDTGKCSNYFKKLSRVFSKRKMQMDDLNIFVEKLRKLSPWWLMLGRRPESRLGIPFFLLIIGGYIATREYCSLKRPTRGILSLISLPPNTWTGQERQGQRHWDWRWVCDCDDSSLMRWKKHHTWFFINFWERWRWWILTLGSCGVVAADHLGNKWFSNVELIQHSKIT